MRRRHVFLPATICILVVNVAAYVRPHVGRSFHWPSIDGSCISLERVVFQGEWIRVVLGPFVHADSWHLCYNMASFIWKARTLEKHYGSGCFLYLVSVFTVLTSLLYVASNYLIVELFNSYSAELSCAVGFSGVIFAVKVVTTHLQPAGMTRVMGIPVPKRLTVWAELILISVLVPRASFVGHLAGILVGLAFVGGPLKQLMHFPQFLLQGKRDAAAWKAVHRSLANSGTYANSRHGEDGHSSEQMSYSYTALPSDGSSAPILFYNRDEPYFEFTNFARFPIVIDGLQYPTSEHYYQSQKLIGTPFFAHICSLPSARQAFEFPRRPHVSQWIRKDWDSVKEGVMYRALVAKFQQHRELQFKLISTGRRKLVEHSPFDSYWGDGPDGKGLNMLGILLMRLRDTRAFVKAPGESSEATLQLMSVDSSMLTESSHMPQSPTANWITCVVPQAMKHLLKM